MAISQSHIINIQPGVSAPLVIHCSQGDTGTQINLTVVNGDEEFDCSSYACSVHGVRSDGGNWGPITCTVSGSTVCFSLTSAMTAVAGACLAEISVGTVGTANFAMLMEKATFGNGVTYSNDVSVYQNILNAVQAGLSLAEAAVTNEKDERIAAVNAEATARQNADATLQNNIDAEATARQNADATLQNNIDAEAAARQSADNTLQGNINSEAATRASADSNLQSQINQIVAPSGEAPSAAEVQNARIGVDGVTYDTLGNAIRGQVGDLKSALTKGAVFGKIVFTQPSGSGHAPLTAGDTLSYNVKQGEKVYISVSTSVSYYVQVLAYYSDGTNSVIAEETVGASGLKTEVTASKDIVLFGIYTPSQSSNCTVKALFSTTNDGISLTKVIDENWIEKTDYYPFSFKSEYIGTYSDILANFADGIQFINIANADLNYDYFVGNTYKNGSSNERNIYIKRLEKGKTGIYLETIFRFTATNTDGTPPEKETITGYGANDESITIRIKWGSIGNNYSVDAMIDPQCVNVGNGFFNQIDHDNDVHKGFPFTGNIVCESEGDHKRSVGYDTTTRLPSWTDNDDFRTYTVPCLKSGSFVAPLRADGDTTNCQLYFLNSEGKVVDNTVNSRETVSTTYYSKDGQKITTNNGVLYSAGVRYITFTFRVTGTYKVIPSVISNGAYQPSWLYSDNSSLQDNIEIIMPPKYAICGGIQSNVYYQNIVRYYNTKMLQMVEGSSSQYYIPFEYFARYTPSADSETDIYYKLYFYIGDAKKSDLETPWIHVNIVPKSSGSGITKNVMLIGDSITAYGIYSGELVNMFSNDVMDITLLGTQGSGANKTEGRYGWRAYTYCRCANGSDDVSSLEGTNPFYNNGHFDFSKYMTDQGYTDVDYVFINLGTNDLIRGNHASDADLKSYFDEMITSINAYNSNIKIVVWLPPTRALYVNNNLSGINNALRMNKLLIDWYKNKESDKLFLCPVYINIDPYHDYNFTESDVSARNSNFTFDYCTDNVHPSDAGFYKIADMIYSEIKYLVTLE